jgi:hypothetical protein
MLITLNLYGAIRTVGVGKTYPTITTATTTALAPGDVIEIYPGTYNEYKKLTVSGTAGSPITIRGMGAPKPVIDGAGLNLTGSGAVPRALFQIEGNYYVIDNLEFKNADNTTSHNAAGIRVLGDNVTVRNCKITECENGMMSDSAGLLVEYSEIAYCGSPDYQGYTHNMYMGGTSLTVRNCYLHDSDSAQNIKSRAHYTELLYNYIADANSKEVDLVEASETNAANSNALLIGNIIIKRNAAPISGISGNDSQFILFGQDGGGTRSGTLYMFNNTIISGMSSNRPIWLSSTTSAVLHNNIFYGTDTLLRDAYTIANTTGSNNWIPTTATEPTGFTNTIKGTAPGFIDAAGRDYHLNLSSSCINAGKSLMTYVDGSGLSKTAVPSLHYVNHLQNLVRPSDVQLDLGAYEYGTGSTPSTTVAGGGTVDPFINLKTYPNPVTINETTANTFKLINLPTGTTMDICNVKGSKVRSLREADFGYGRILWDGKNDSGELVGQGVYLYLLKATDGSKKAGKIAILR